MVLAAAIFLAFNPWARLDEIPVHAKQADGGYADPATCGTCHAAIANSYRQTAMAQSFHRADGSTLTQDFEIHNTVYNRASDRHYIMFRQDGAWFEQRFQIGFEGKETNREQVRIDYIVGSGSHARTYLHRTAEGKLIELPVSWYSEGGGYWEMSPGYDDPHQQDFRRAIPWGCMSCHNAYPSSDLAHDSPDKNIFGADLPEGIDCQRCHGPGQAHIDAVDDGESKEAIRAAIVNPARLSRDRQMDVCMQCHLETTSWPLPHSIRRVEQTAFSYRPGEPLENYQLTFDHKPGTGYDGNFEVVHQAYQLRKSVCFQRSQMTCITCHDPHQELHGDEATKHYIAVCVGCHTGAHSPEKRGEPRPATMTSVQGSNCLTCHMWKRRTSDAVHVVMTDHDIQRFRPPGDPLAAKPSPGYYRGEVVAYYPKSLDGIPNGELYLDIAQIEDDTNLPNGADRLRRAIEKHKPAAAEFYFAMGTACSKLGKNDEAIGWYRDALRRRPDYQQAERALAAALEASGDLAHAAEVGEKAAAASHPDTAVLTNLGDVYLKLGRLDDARRVLLQALLLNPDLPDAAVLLGIAARREGDNHSAESWYRAAIVSEPDFAEAHNNLAGLLAQRGDYAEAAYEFERAEQADPDNVQIRSNYAILLANTGSLDKAVAEMQDAVRLDPASVRNHVRLGDLLIESGDADGAVQEYGRAVARDEQDGSANLKLANALVKVGKNREAERYYRIAAKSADAKIRDAAFEALHK